MDVVSVAFWPRGGVVSAAFLSSEGGVVSVAL